MNHETEHLSPVSPIFKKLHPSTQVSAFLAISLNLTAIPNCVLDINLLSPCPPMLFLVMTTPLTLHSSQDGIFFCATSGKVAATDLVVGHFLHE